MHCTVLLDSERIMNLYQRQIYGHLSKKQCRKNNTISKIVQYRCEKGNSHTPDKYWGYGCFLLYKVSKMGEGDLVLMSIDAFEKREQTLQLHANVLQAEQERIDGAPTLSVSEARKQLRERMKNV